MEQPVIDEEMKKKIIARQMMAEASSPADTAQIVREADAVADSSGLRRPDAPVNVADTVRRSSPSTTTPAPRSEQADIAEQKKAMVGNKPLHGKFSPSQGEEPSHETISVIKQEEPPENQPFKFPTINTERREKPESSGGFNFFRGLAAVGDNLEAYDKHKADVRQQNEAAKMLDPNSDISRQHQQEFINTSKLLADIHRDNAPIVKTLQENAAAAPGMHAAQIARMYGMYDKALPQAMRLAHDRATEELSRATLGVNQKKEETGEKKADIEARRANAYEMSVKAQANNLNVDNKREQEQFEWKKQEAEAKREADKKKNQLRLQFKGGTALNKAMNELGTLDTMNEQIKAAEEALPKAMTGPYTDAALTMEGAANSTVGKWVGADKLIPEKMSQALAATRTARANLEQTVADMRKERHGASFTPAEQNIVNEWKPNIQLGEEDNKLLISALRKYMSAKAHQKIRQSYQDIGLPIQLPDGVHLSLNDALSLKNKLEGMNKYDDDQRVGAVDDVNAILQKYGGSIATGSSKPTAAKTRQVGDEIKNPKTGEIRVWDGKQWAPKK